MQAIQEANVCGKENSTTIPQQVDEQATAMELNADTPPNDDDDSQEVINASKNTEPPCVTNDNRDSDTPSPMEYCEGQLFVLNKSSQFVKFHAVMGDKYMVTSKGLEKIEEEPNMCNQVLTLRGRFSFRLENSPM